ncbi:MAG: ABC transporter ATP-binding protein [Candidatus Hydrogenedentes bacterium]|nr:ABC transporter ATP-binding protein [Candidatus Hydrogenedentota bacterium]
MPTCIEIASLTKRFGSTLAVNDLTLNVERGEVTGLLGPNGAGKSTTLLMLLGLVRPTSGAIRIFGKELNRDFLQIIERVGAVLEKPSFYDFLTARENLRLLAKLAGLEMTLDRFLDRVGLLSVAHKKVGTFSQGMRQRLALAQAMLAEPELLVLDEPTTALDPEGIHETLDLLRQLADESRVTVLISSHRLDEVETVCDRVAVLNQGRLVACEKVETLLSYDEHDVEVFVDGPEAAAKRLAEQGWVERAEAWSGRVRVHLRDGSVHQLTAFLISGGFKISAVVPRRQTVHDFLTKVLKS